MDSFILFSSVLVAACGAIESKPVLPFFELSEDASVFTDVDDATTPVDFPTPFHFNDIIYSSAYISSNGLVSFGTSYISFVPKTLPLLGYNIIAPYWEDIYLFNQKGAVFFESYSNNNDIALRNISDFITSSQALSKRYNPLSAVIIYWSDVCPIGDSNCINTSSFQAVLTSNEKSSYAIFTYKCGSLNWNEHYAGIGYSAGTEFYKNHILSRNLNVNDIACLNEPHSEWSNVVYRVDKDRPTDCVTDSVRLVRGSGSNEGQVELCVSQFWHPVCDDGFTVNETKLICKALGYDSGVKEIISKDADPRDNNNELYTVNCNNQETSLDDCSINPCVDSTDIGQPFIYCHGINPVCETDCNPSSGHEECCNDDNIGKFIETKPTDSLTIKYLVCPTNKPDNCT